MGASGQQVITGVDSFRQISGRAKLASISTFESEEAIIIAKGRHSTIRAADRRSSAAFDGDARIKRILEAADGH